MEENSESLSLINKPATLVAGHIGLMISNALQERGFQIIHIWTKEKTENHDRTQKRTLFCDKMARKFKEQ